MINSIPSEFDFLSNINKKVTIEGGKIYFPYKSTFFYWLIAFTSFILPFFIYIIGKFFINSYSLKIIQDYDKIGMNLVYNYCIGALVFFTVIGFFAEFNNVIDFPKNCFYKQIKILFIEFKFQIIYPKEINYITNNCIVANNMFNPSGINKYGYYEGEKAERNSKTNQIQKYYVSFLLKNGKLINFIELGIFERDYFTSIKLADTLANFWYIPLFKCKDYCTLKETRNNSNNAYFIEEEIKPFNEWLFILYLIIAMFLTFFIPVSISYLLYG